MTSEKLWKFICLFALMKKLLQIFIVLCLTSCANIVAPTGGKKDINAPKLQKTNSTENLQYIHKKIETHLDNAGTFEVAYVFVKGFGNAYPYIRASRFMNNFEKYIKGFKLIMFYPGEAKNYYSLFGLLKDENLYRAIKLINA